jgi:hypothetical protein
MRTEIKISGLEIRMRKWDRKEWSRQSGPRKGVDGTIGAQEGGGWDNDIGAQEGSAGGKKGERGLREWRKKLEN